jgi:hypothetical protein
MTDAQTISAFVLASHSGAGRLAPPRRGLGAQASYSYSTRTWSAAGTVEHFDDGFEMDTAFVNRVGVSGGWAFVERNFYPDNRRHPWLRRVSLFTFHQGGRDEGAGGGEYLALGGLRLAMTRQGNLRVDYLVGHEHWAGQRFPRGRPRVSANMQVLRWLAFDLFAAGGHAVYYDPLAPFRGRVREWSGGLTLQPSGRLAQSLRYQRVAFDRAATGERVYTLDIVNTRTAYQFTRALALRGIVQYDSARRRVLTDLLGSYEPRPGTVVYAGYGALLEQRDYVDGQWIPQQGAYLTTQRGLFFKASYLYRF